MVTVKEVSGKYPEYNKEYKSDSDTLSAEQYADSLEKRFNDTVWVVRTSSLELIKRSEYYTFIWDEDS